MRGSLVRWCAGIMGAACAVIACSSIVGGKDGEGTASTSAAVSTADSRVDVQLLARTERCDGDRVKDVLEVRNTGTSPVPLSAISIRLWVDDTSGEALDATVESPGRVTGDPACARDVHDVTAHAGSFTPACGPDPHHQANWEVSLSDEDGAVLAPGATWEGIALELRLRDRHDYRPGTSDWYSACATGKDYAHTGSIALYVGGKLATSSTGVPPACRAPHGSQQLTGMVAAGQGNVPLVGPLPASTPLQLDVALPLTNEPALEAALQALYDPASPTFHHYLTPAAFGQAYGASPSDYQALADYVKARNLTVVGQSPSRHVLTVSGAAADVESAFHVTVNLYEKPDGTSYFAPANEPSVDLGAALLYIEGLESATHASPADNGGGTSPFTCPYGPSPYKSARAFAGTDLADVYFPCNTSSATPLDGTGQTVALYEQTGVYANDYLDYANPAQGGFEGLNPTPSVTVKVVGVPAIQPPLPPLSGNCSAAPERTLPDGAPLPNPPNCQSSALLDSGLVPVDGGPPRGTVDLQDVQREDEPALDVQMVQSIAPKASIVLYETNMYVVSGGGETPAVNAKAFSPAAVFQQIADDDLAQTVSVSWWWQAHAGFNPALADAFRQLAMQGQSLFISSMDLGAYVPGEPLPNVPDPMIDSVYSTVVGGTHLTTTGTASQGTLAYQAETTWNDPRNTTGSSCVNTAPYLDPAGAFSACNSVSGGGICTAYTRLNSDGTVASYPGLPLPAYQANLPTQYGGSTIPPNPELGTAARMIPDVSMPADALTVFAPAIRETPPGDAGAVMDLPDGGTVTLFESPSYTVYDPVYTPCQGGTSAATPLWAATVALVNQALGAKSLPPVGFANPMLYRIAATSGASYQGAFHDVADGSKNNYAGAPNAYSAQAGYDLTTGLGSPACGLLTELQCVTCPGTGCIDLETDSNNCGSCGHGCLGGACAGGQCQPIVLTTDPAPLGIALSGTAVYWIDGAGSVHVVQKDGTGAALLTTQSNGSGDDLGAGASPIAVSGSTLYWSYGNGMWSMPLGSTTPTLLGTYGAGVGQFAVTGGLVYFGVHGPDSINTVPVTGGASSILVPSTAESYGFVIQGGNIFWSATALRQVVQMPLAGGAQTVIASLPGAETLTQLTADATNVYFSTGTDVMSVPLGGGSAPTELGPANTWSDSAIAVDAAGVYLTTGSPFAVLRFPLAGGAPTVLDLGNESLGIAADGQAVYWTDTTNGRVMKVAE
jgi:hypothetical protein